MKRLLQAARLLLAAALLIVTGTAAVIYLYGRYGAASPAERADAAIVLGAAVRRGQPSPALRERLEHGLTLYRARRVGKLLFTGGSGVRGELPEAQVARRYALARGVPEADILLEERSHTTEGNLYFAAAVARRAGLGRFLLVSDPLHLRRAITMGRDLGLAIAPSPTPTTVFRGWRSQAEFLGRETYKTLKYLARRTLGDPFDPEHL